MLAIEMREWLAPRCGALLFLDEGDVAAPFASDHPPRKAEPITQPSQPSSAKRANAKRSIVTCPASSQNGGPKWLVG